MPDLAYRRSQQAQEAEIPEGWVMIPTAARLTGIPASTLRDWAQKERMRVISISPRVRYVNLDEVRKVAATLKPGPAKGTPRRRK
jgi:hypothetical protein